MNVDLRDFRGAFVAEVEEHLSAIQTLLLEIEGGSRQGQPAPRALREAMRLVHTIKGLAAMVGVDEIVGLVHRMETVLRAGERSGGRLEERAVAALIEGTKTIATGIRAVATQRPVPAPSPALLRELDELDDPAPLEAPTLSIDPELAAKLGPSEQVQLVAGAKAGRRALRADFKPSAERAARGISITTVRERLGAVAEIVKVVPLSGPNGLLFAIFLLTDTTDAAIADIVDGSAAEVTALVANAPPPALPVPALVETADDDAPIAGGRDVLRVEVSRVDEAIDLLADLVVTRARMAHAVARLEAAQVDTRELRTILGDEARQLRALRAAILRVRMIPMKAVLERMPLVVRSLARSSGKQLEIVVHAGSGELDKSVAERLFPALVHLVRNAVDHGIERAEERGSKSPVGRLTIETNAGDRSVEVRISDDGRGVDRAAVAARAGQPVPSSNAALLDLLCRSGLSTRSEVGLTSGRGIGMDIVRKTIVQGLGGELSLETTPGQGTTFILRIPLTVAIVDAFVVRCGDARYAIPVPIVEEILELGDARTVSAPNPKAGATTLLARRGASVPLFSLGRALLGSGHTDSESGHVLVIRVGDGELAAYVVDRVLSQQEIVVRPMPDALVSAPALAGTTDLGDGKVTIVVDLLTLSMRGREAA